MPKLTINSDAFRVDKSKLYVAIFKFDKDKEMAFKYFGKKNNYDDILEKSINYSSLNNRLDLLIKRVKFASPKKLENILKYKYNKSGF